MTAAADHPPILTVCGATVAFNRWGQRVLAVNSVNFSASRGEWIALTGPNGAGKSTLLRALMGLAPIEDGQLILEGRRIDPNSSRHRSKRMFLVHQSPLLGTAPLLTPTENLIVAGALSRPEARAMLDEMGIGARADQPASSLSGGERQWLALRIATLRRPSVLLLDEPFSALDRAREAQCLAMLREFRLKGSAVVQITHQPTLLTGYATREIRLEDGKIAADGPFPQRAGAT